jgi:site-specific recombinase XerD
MNLSISTQGFLTSLKADGYSPSTINLYQYVLDNLCSFLGDKEIEKIKSADLTRFFAFLRDGYKPDRKNKSDAPLSGSTLQNHWKGIRTFFKWAELELELKARPDTHLKLPGNNPKVIMPLPENEIKALLKAAVYSEFEPSNRKPFKAKRRTADRDLALILALLDTGLRVGELCRLNVQDVNLENGDVYIAPFGNSNKKTKSRIVYLGKASKRAVWRYLASRANVLPNAPLFVTERAAKRITVNSVRLLLADLGHKAGINDTHPHRFRHTFCIEFLRNGGDVFALQSLTGHSDIDMLKTYLQLAKGDAARVHKVASPVDNWRL